MVNILVCYISRVSSGRSGVQCVPNLRWQHQYICMCVCVCVWGRGGGGRVHVWRHKWSISSSLIVLSVSQSSVDWGTSQSASYAGMEVFPFKRHPSVFCCPAEKKLIHVYMVVTILATNISLTKGLWLNSKTQSYKTAVLSLGTRPSNTEEGLRLQLSEKVLGKSRKHNILEWIVCMVFQSCSWCNG